MNITIRNETEADIDAISEVTKAAFATNPHSRQTEQFIVIALRREKALTISLVAEVDNKVVGHIALSPVTVSDGSAGWYGLGPISVVPELQRKGIGTALMHESFARLKALDASGVMLVGDPGYYTRFGFATDPGLILEGVPPQYFLSRRFKHCTTSGAVTFHKAFMATA